MHELNIPIQVKYLFKRADNSLFSPYVTVAYHLRYLLPGRLKVRENGNLILEDNPEVRFRNSLLDKKMNAFISAGLGWQKNSLRASKGSFFAELNVRYGFSSYFIETSYAASALYMNAVHISLQLGLKF
jgi:hypothetical protein